MSNLNDNEAVDTFHQVIARILQRLLADSKEDTEPQPAQEDKEEELQWLDEN
ncbi:MAG: hypothetical protein JXA14_27755 [Anaerolineae bacterium]|nr:hypothetical protein [Anaerolineae bacterium]